MTATFASYLEELADPAQPLAISKLAGLSKLEPDQIDELKHVWQAMDLRRRAHLLEELTDLTEDNVEFNFDAVFFNALGDSDAEVRRDAIRGLWEYEGRDFIDVLLSLLQNDENAAVRAEAALALGRFALLAEYDTLRPSDVQRIEDTLRRVIEDDSEVVEVRARALESIGARSQPWVRDLIEAALDGGERVLRLSAIHAMGRSADPIWLPELLETAESDDAEQRFEAATALGAIADETAVPQLRILLEDEDDEVREAAIVALGEIGGAESKEALGQIVAEGDERMRDAAAEALGAADFAIDPLGTRVRESS